MQTEQIVINNTVTRDLGNRQRHEREFDRSLSNLIFRIEFPLRVHAAICLGSVNLNPKLLGQPEKLILAPAAVYQALTRDAELHYVSTIEMFR